MRLIVVGLAAALVSLAMPWPAMADSFEDGLRGADATQDAFGNAVVTAVSEAGAPLPVGRRPTGSVTCRWFLPAVPPAGNVDFGQRTLADASRGTSLDVHAAEIEAVICYGNVDCD